MVDTEEKLADFLPMLQAAHWVAVDTEADSLHAYPEKVCLIQISTAAGDRLVDPLAGFPLDSLLEALGGHQLIMHGADYDLRLLQKHHKFVPSSIFDTMLGARLLGIQRFSLSDLVEKHLGVKLEKGPQKANWALRPLTERMEKYARNDTHYLKALSDQLRSQLDQAGRLAWHTEFCARLILDCTNDARPDPDAVWRIKGSHRLDRPALAILKELWHWRETEAVGGNRPPFFVLSHELLTGIADAAASGHRIEALFPRHLSERRRAGIRLAVEKGLAVPADHYPRIPRSTSRRPSEAQRRRYVELQKRRDARAAQLGLDPTLLASRSILSDLAHDWDKHASELMKWQRELLEPHS